MSQPMIRAEHGDGVDRLVLASARNRNALSLQLLEELLSGIAGSVRGDARALVLDHEGPAFCAGVDLRERRQLGADSDAHSRLLARVIKELWDCPKPVLCRIDGRVRGGGLAMVACCDIAVASSRADFAFSEVRVGVAPALAASVPIAKVPLGLLLPWLVTGEAFDAGTAQRMGLISRVADDPEVSLQPEITAMLHGAPSAVQTVKRLARRHAGADVDTVLQDMEALSADLFRHPEAAEGMAAFFDRRPPAWVPR
jgi:enoyl-CoA hydratase/carnithine racemase